MTFENSQSDIVILSASSHNNNNSNGKKKHQQPRNGTEKIKRKKKKRQTQSSSYRHLSFTSRVSYILGFGPATKPLHKAGIVLLMISLILYIIGFIQSIRSLPDVDNEVVRWGAVKWRPLAAAGSSVGKKVKKFLTKRKLNDIADGTTSGKMVKNNKVEKEQLQQRLRNAVAKKEQLEEKLKNTLTKDDTITTNSIPKSQWPVSIRDEDEQMEDIIHPGNPDVTMPVPKFWSPRQIIDPSSSSPMNPDVAAGIGSYVDGSVDVSADHKGNPDNRTIFVAIASYRDWQCRYTVESILLRAKYPQRVRIAIVDQISPGDAQCGVPIKPCTTDPHQGLCRYTNNIDVFEIDAPLAVGPVFARHIGHRLYRGEYYAMQIDAHVTFVQDWDVDIISQMEATHNEMAVLSTYLTDIIDALDEETGKSLVNTRPIMCNTDYESDPQGKHLRHGSQPELVPSVRGTPQLQPYWAAGYSFSRGHFVVNVPYDLYLPMIFQGEEIGIGLRGFTYGYDFYAPERSVCFHTYAEGVNAKKRNKVKHFWEHSNSYRGLEKKSMQRLLGIIDMNHPKITPDKWDHTEEQRYGKGNVRQTSQFFDTFGIYTKTQTVEKHLCKFVHTGKMHHKFTTHLRSDGMGIDYSQIHYQFKDTMKKKRDDD